MNLQEKLKSQTIVYHPSVYESKYVLETLQYSTNQSFTVPQWGQMSGLLRPCAHLPALSLESAHTLLPPLQRSKIYYFTAESHQTRS